MIPTPQDPTLPRRRRGRWAAVAVTLGLAVLPVACSQDDGGSVREVGGASGSASGSGSGSGSASGSGSGSAASDCTDEATGDETVELVLDEFSIVPDRGEVPAGDVVLRATNEGDEVHEVLVLRTEEGRTLTTLEDGSFDESALDEGVVVGEIEGIGAGRTCSASFDLTPGTYLLVCNIVETEEDGTVESHYHEGMVISLTAT